MLQFSTGSVPRDHVGLIVMGKCEITAMGLRMGGWVGAWIDGWMDG